MPIANCFIKNRQVSSNDMQEMASKWAKMIDVDLKDICLTFIPNCVQGGQQYEFLINLYLPSLYADADVENIQSSLLDVLMTHFKIDSSAIFIMVSIIQSGHVLENGQIIKW